MKLSELMENYTPNAAFTGFVMADDMVLAIDISDAQDADVGDYAVLQFGIEGVDSSLNSETSEKNYLRSGKSTTKTGTQRTFTVSGDMYIGDEAQDKLLSHTMKYATGQGAILNYVYFNVLTGVGEKGSVTVAVNTDGGGNASESASIDIELSKSGSAPPVFNWLTDSTVSGTEASETTDSGTEASETTDSGTEASETTDET